MRKSVLWLVVFALSGNRAPQVTAEVRLDRTSSGRRIGAVTALSIARPAALPGRRVGSLSLSNRATVRRREEFRGPVAGEFQLESAKAALKHIDLTPITP
jgi:hypothetical protein